MSHERSSRPVDAVLAEFAALRHEIDDLGKAQRTVINLNITTAAAVLGFVLSQKADSRLLLVVPFASSAFGFLYQRHTTHIRRIGDYIDQQIRPLLVEYAADFRVFGWERHVRSGLYPGAGSRLSMRMAYMLLFPAIPAASLLAVLPYLDGSAVWIAWCVGVVLFIFQVTTWLVEMWSWVGWI